MSWLFGFNKEVPSDFASFPNLPDEKSPPDESETSKTSSDEDEVAKVMGYQFDPSGLERAARTARELGLSNSPRESLNSFNVQESAKLQDLQNKLKEFETQYQNAKAEERQVEQEERRKTAAEEARHNKQRAQNQDQYARSRYEDQLVLQKQAAEENLIIQEEFAVKREAIKKATIEREIELRSQADLKQIQTQYYAKAKADRENQDLYLRRIREEAAEHRATILESIKTAGSVIGAGFDNFISDWGRVSTTISGAVLLALGIYSAKAGTGVAARYVEARFSKPSLVRETSRVTLVSALKHPVKTAKIFMTKPKDVMRGVILKPSLEERLSNISIATRNTRKNRGMYQNLLMYGPPGTGKTLFAKRLAQHCGMDYAIMSGGDVAPMGRDGVTAVHKLFDWASTSRRGLLLFVDEADAFLRKRSSEEISEDMRATLNAFLHRTGEQSHKFMLVLASNTPEQFDWAVNDRLDEMICLELPGLEERKRLIHLYFDKYVLTPATEGKRRLKVEHFDYGALCSEIAEVTDGLSGREISKLGVAWQAAAFASEDGVLTRKMIMDRVWDAVQQHKQLSLWQSEEEQKKTIPGSPKDGSSKPEHTNPSTISFI